MQAIILAGGKGTRLKPFTNVIPKPLVPIGDIPILEVILRQLHHYGITKVVIAVNHLARLIEAFFGNGSSFGLDITYSLEEHELGTASPISLIEHLEEDFFVMNGDLLTTINYSDLFDYHKKHRAIATIATFRKEIKIDLGVLETKNNEFINYIEKPTYYFTVSMGIYVLNSKILNYIPKNEKFDMPDLLLALHKAKENIKCYSGEYDWLDIGRIDDYEKAVDLFISRRELYLPS
jgi:NDP-mannose synthase